MTDEPRGYDKLDHTLTDEMVCPYCLHVNKDSQEYGPDDGTVECGECARPFRYTRNIRVTYTTRRETE